MPACACLRVLTNREAPPGSITEYQGAFARGTLVSAPFPSKLRDCRVLTSGVSAVEGTSSVPIAYAPLYRLNYRGC